MVFFVRSGGDGWGEGEGPLCFSRRTLSEAREGEVEVVTELLKANANVNKEDNYGTMALFQAVKHRKNDPVLCVRGLHF